LLNCRWCFTATNTGVEKLSHSYLYVYNRTKELQQRSASDECDGYPVAQMKRGSLVSFPSWFN
jgi:hypothetical protein